MRTLTLALLLSFCGVAQSAAPDQTAKQRLSADAPKSTVLGNTFIAPAGWSVAVHGPATIVEAPEGDSRIVIVDVRAKDEPFTLQRGIGAVERANHVSASPGRRVWIQGRGQRHVLKKRSRLAGRSQAQSLEFLRHELRGTPLSGTSRQSPTEGVVGQIAHGRERKIQAARQLVRRWAGFLCGGWERRAEHDSQADDAEERARVQHTYRILSPTLSLQAPAGPSAQERSGARYGQKFTAPQNVPEIAESSEPRGRQGPCSIGSHAGVDNRVTSGPCERDRQLDRDRVLPVPYGL